MLLNIAIAVLSGLLLAAGLFTDDKDLGALLLFTGPSVTCIWLLTNTIASHLDPAVFTTLITVHAVIAVATAIILVGTAKLRPHTHLSTPTNEK